MRLPINKPVYGFKFGYRYPYSWYFIRVGLAGKRHQGQDFICPINTKLYAPSRIQQARIYTDQIPGGSQHPDYGRCIYAYDLDNPGLVHVFAHLMAVGIPRVGKIWQKGEMFAWSGNTGKSNAAHLHWEVRRNNVQINPLQFINE